MRNSMPYRFCLIIALLLANISVAHSQQTPAVKWQASWIWDDRKFSEPNTWVALRKEVQLKDINQSMALISADTKYWLWINGDLVVFEGAYTGGPSPVKPSPRVDNFQIASNKYYDKVDITPYLHKGSNTIAALAWYYGDNGEKGTHISSNKAGFIFQAQIGQQLVISDDTWKVQAHPAYKTKINKNPPYRVAAWNIEYDATKALGDWTNKAWYQPGYDDTQWQQAKTMHSPPRAPFYALFPSEIPILNDYGLANCVNYPDSAFPFISDGKPIKCKLDFNKNITPFFDIEAEAGLTVHVDSNMRLNTIETFYTTKQGRQQFESYSWLNARVLEYTFPKGVKVHGLKYRWTGLGTTPGHFETDDPWFTRIWQMAENTLYICARDNFMDTPDRERGLWIGDVADQASYLFYSMDQPGRDLLKKAIKVTLAFSDSESGIFAGLGPGRFRELPAQSLQFIDQAIWHYYYNTGDIETIKFAYPYVHKYLMLWEVKNSGLVTLRPGDWKWTDWGPQETIDYDVIHNALYFSALVAANKMAKAVGDDTHVALYQQRIAALKKAFRETYWQQGFYSSNPNKFRDDRANAIAIMYDLASAEQNQAIVDNVLIPNHFASPHFEWMVYNAMAKAGRYQDALARMKTRYSHQVDNPKLSTLAEYLPSGGTENHAWNAPSTVLSQYIAGIYPTSVAWKTFNIMPNLAHFKKVEQRVPSVSGDISISLEHEVSGFSAKLITPDNTTALLGIPKKDIQIKQVKVNSTAIWQQGKPVEHQLGISWVEETDKYLIFSVPAGEWEFLAASTL